MYVTSYIAVVCRGTLPHFISHRVCVVLPLPLSTPLRRCVCVFLKFWLPHPPQCSSPSPKTGNMQGMECIGKIRKPNRVESQATGAFRSHFWQAAPPVASVVSARSKLAVSGAGTRSFLTRISSPMLLPTETPLLV